MNRDKFNQQPGYYTLNGYRFAWYLSVHSRWEFLQCDMQGELPGNNNIIAVFRCNALKPGYIWLRHLPKQIHGE